MGMRMQELAERSGLPKTTIHHYAREGLLPPARKTAPNAAVYGEEHLERLRLVARLREDEALSIPEIRSVLRHLDAGASPRAAVRMAREAVAPPKKEGRWDDLGELAASAELGAGFVGELAEVGLLGTAERDGFTPGDLFVARACEEACRDGAVDARDLRPLADLIAEVGNYSGTLVDVSTAAGAAAGAEPAPEELRRRLARLCEALLWRAFSDPGPG